MAQTPTPQVSAWSSADGRFHAFWIDPGTRRGNRYDAHPGEWFVWEGGATVAIVPTLEAAQAFVAAQVDPVIRMAQELMFQEAAGLRDEPAEIRAFWGGLPDFDRARYERRALLLLDAYGIRPHWRPTVRR